MISDRDLGSEQDMGGLQERIQAQICKSDRDFFSGFLVFAGAGRRAEKNGPHAEISTEQNIGKRVADHQTSLRPNVGELGLSLLEKAREGLAAVTFLLIVGTEVKRVDLCSMP